MFFFLLTVNVAYSPSQNIQGQATMSEPPQHYNWQAYKIPTRQPMDHHVRSLNFIRDTHQFG